MSFGSLLQEMTSYDPRPCNKLFTTLWIESLVTFIHIRSYRLKSPHSLPQCSPFLLLNPVRPKDPLCRDLLYWRTCSREAPRPLPASYPVLRPLLSRRGGTKCQGTLGLDTVVFVPSPMERVIPRTGPPVSYVPKETDRDEQTIHCSRRQSRPIRQPISLCN